MAKIDELKEIKSDLKEVFKSLLYTIIALLTGIATIVFKTLVGSIPAHMIILGFIGLIIIFLVILYTLKIWNKMQQINKEMRDAD
jgi:F0F1-type ATP synthase assembly protein I